MTYHDEVKKKQTLLLREYLSELPVFAAEYFRSEAETLGARTRAAYAYELKLFFEFLIAEFPEFSGISMRSFGVSDLARVGTGHIEEFFEYLTYHTKEDGSAIREYRSEEAAKSRKLAAIRKLFRYFYKKEKLEKDPAALVDFPKLHEKAIVRLDVGEVARLLDEVESGEHLTERQQILRKGAKKRDLALITLLLGTGMRVSECVGIDIGHVDFEENAVKVTRKGGKEAILFFGDEVHAALWDYLEERKFVKEKDGHENALFLSHVRQRITVRAVENLVQKYARLVTPLKKITPHKLRSTFGTNLYRESGDIYLVADVLGHTDVNTTKRHYAAMDEEKRRDAVKFVRLREK